MRGIGTDTKQASAIYFMIEDLLSIFALFMAYFCMNFECRNIVVCCLIFRVIKMIRYEGIIDPINANKKASRGEIAFEPHIALFIARGTAILLSSVGNTETNNTASQTQLSKLFVKKSVIKLIL